MSERISDEELDQIITSYERYEVWPKKTATALLELQVRRKQDAIVAELLGACKAKLADCRDGGDCMDAALQPDEYCSDECSAMARAIKLAERRG